MQYVSVARAGLIHISDRPTKVGCSCPMLIKDAG